MRWVPNWSGPSTASTSQSSVRGRRRSPACSARSLTARAWTPSPAWHPPGRARPVTPPAPPTARLDDLPVPDYAEYFQRAENLGVLPRAGHRRMRASLRERAGLLVGGQAPLHVLRAERDVDVVPAQVGRPGAGGARPAGPAVPDVPLRGGRQHPRHGVLHRAVPGAPRPAGRLRTLLRGEVGPAARAAQADGASRCHAHPARHRVAQHARAAPHAQGRPRDPERQPAPLGPVLRHPGRMEHPVGFPGRDGRGLRRAGRGDPAPAAPAAAGGGRPDLAGALQPSLHRERHTPARSPDTGAQLPVRLSRRRRSGPCGLFLRL